MHIREQLGRWFEWSRTKNPESAPWKVDVHAGESADTCVLHAQDVVGTLDGVILAAKGKRQVG